MKIADIIRVLEEEAPLAYQESYDNSGLIIGNPETELSNALICLDSTEAIVDEAIQTGCNLIIAHHPIIFKGLKKINGKNYIERTVIKAIQNNIAIYAIHTNLDNIYSGVNQKIAQILGLSNSYILSPKTNTLRKLAVFCPESHSEKVRLALNEAGAGNIGNYDQCSFNTKGIGTFRANNQAKPFVGELNQIHLEQEVKIEVIFPFPLQERMIKTLQTTHPYEEIAYDLYTLENQNQSIGSGMVGELPEEITEMEFLGLLKSKLNANCIKHTALLGKKVKKIALCGGSGSFLLKDAIREKCDFFVTADFKYHDFFDAENRITIADVGHYESEQFTKELLRDFLMKKFRTFAPLLSSINTNPVNYF
ncbi:MAG: Nif3-like dinuclear metal center hexameric protein [Bacteroidia bacterium]|nr:Nif3-like dinuclear metal center hexameric protein [Bacteroidia bacterium]